MSVPRLLVVDDDIALLQALPETLRLRLDKVAVETCDSALGALERVTVTDYDAIVCDIKMPGMDGLALLAKIRQLRPDVPILLITGHGEHDLAVQALRGGAYDFIQKPIDRDHLVASIDRAIQMRRLSRQVKEQQLALERHADELEQMVQERTRELLEANRTKDELLVARNYALSEAERAQRQLALLAEASRVLASSLDYSATLAQVARVIVPALADWCTVYVTEPDQPPRLVAAAHVDPAKKPLMHELQRRYPIEAHSVHPVLQVLRTGRAALYLGNPDELLAAMAPDAEHMELLRGLELKTYIAMPLLARGRILGAITFASLQLGRHYDPADIALAEDLARRCAAAVDHAMLYREAQEEIAERKRAEEALRHARDELERRVQERTAALGQAVDDLRREIAERQQAEAQLRHQEEVLYQREKLAAMGSLLASVAHELNNPLSVVMMQADVLREEIREGPLAEQAKAITQSAERCVRIVHNFLTLARQHPPERRPVALNTVVQDAVELLAYALRVDNIEVALQLAPELPTLGADPHQMHQVVVNLLTNAHQALRETPPPRCLTLTTGVDRRRTRVYLEVADSGPGIRPELQERIFEPFFTTKPPGVGTGLGLSLCRGIIEGHGGTISVQGQPGHGAVFRVELPVEEGREEGPSASEQAARPRVKGGTILVVDDEPGIGSALAYLLQREGHAVDTAANGRLALAKLRGQDYDLILCDLRMPELDGPGFYRELQRAYPHLQRRVIFLTGDTLSPDTREFLEKVGVTRLNKPFKAADVRRVVLQALQAR